MLARTTPLDKDDLIESFWIQIRGSMRTPFQTATGSTTIRTLQTMAQRETDDMLAEDSAGIVLVETRTLKHDAVKS